MSTFLFYFPDFACGDLSMCKNYNPNMCNQVWMKRHCKKMCGLCTPPEDETSFSNSPSKETSAPKHCEYSGVIHQSGETWSPGPCVPKCHCDNGHIKCSKLECPDLNCDKPVKRRWKCCPECLPNSDNETRCGVDTSGGNGENLCCVFPFNYRGIDYFTCTTANALEPWCSITRNYDRDGLWGNCVVKSKTGKKHIKQVDSDEKTALVLAAQLSGARKWRNSTNNQATDALKNVPSPLSEDELNKLKASDESSGYANNVYQNASGADGDNLYQNTPGVSAQADDYRNAGADLSQVNALDNASKTPSYDGYQGNSTSTITSPAMTSSPDTSYAAPGIEQVQSSNSSQQAVTSSMYNPPSDYAQTTNRPYSYQTTTGYGDKSSESAGNYSDPRASNTVESNTVGSNPAVSNTGGSNAVGYNTGATNTGGNNTEGSYTGGSYTGESNPVASNTGESNPVASNAGESNTAGSSQYSSYYGEANNPSGVSAYSGSYGQQSTAKDTTDNTVPNGIENQTSYEMNPDASTAQYGNNQPAST